ncbi:pseudouridine synthase [Qiania dongpingensis]|uniref:Pseudouridine synthase n=1 Tax=Qiania dongpingensis TaxID=2763669 RepID=A0A7G9G7E1_9FIRM|nr:pseudouridine synthase [Qiania dongpingensis]QNM06723.1 rRNA pseudouridine synthase [Qiania dongpingensis]
MKIMRLDKFLSDSGLGTRSQVKLLIKKGLISINGEAARKPEQKIDAEFDRIFCQGKPVSYTGSFYYYMLNKPAGYVSATDDNTAPTVLSLLKDAPGKDLFPVGRLDKDTTGLLLITNDGPLAHRLLSPKNHVDKTYFVRVSGIVASEELQLLETGLDIGEQSLTLPAKARLISVLPPQGSEGPVSEVELTIHEGKFHQVKRMFQAIGMPVLYLKRISMGTLELDASLTEGSYRPLTSEETAALKKE